MPRFVLILASASPRRLDLLRSLGLAPIVSPQSVDETPEAGEPADALVRRLARLKAERAEATLGPRASRSVLLGADTVVVLDGEVLGKPRDASEALAMLRRLSGQPHRVLTGICLLRGDSRRSASAVADTAVRFRAIDDATLGAYVAGGEPLDKAGAYAIQGGAAAFVEAIDGSLSNVIGLPLERLAGLLAEIGLALDDLRDGDGA